MNQQIKDVLTEASVKTFEDICFLYVVPELKDEQKKLVLEDVSEVKFKGNLKGKLVIAVSNDLFSAIAGNMLSHDNPSLQQKKDALGEVANIICGNVIPSLEGRGKTGCKIYNPRYFNRQEIQKEGHGKLLTEITLNLNQGKAEIKIFIDDVIVQEKSL